MKEEIAQLIKLGESIKINIDIDEGVYLNQEYYNWISQSKVFLSKIAGQHEELIEINSCFLNLSRKQQTIEIYEALMVVLHTVKNFIYMSYINS